MWFAYFIIGLAIYTIGNAVLHDVFVLINHKGGYDRTLLRLLMDGHILLLSGVMYVLAFFVFKQTPNVALWICIIASLSLIVYCAMIFPFLKSLGTMSLNAIMLGISVYKLFFEHPLTTS